MIYVIILYDYYFTISLNLELLYYTYFNLENNEMSL